MGLMLKWNLLKKSTHDIIETYDNLLSVIKDIKSIRNNIDKEFSKIFEQGEQITAIAGTQPSMPYLTKK